MEEATNTWSAQSETEVRRHPDVLDSNTNFCRKRPVIMMLDKFNEDDIVDKTLCKSFRGGFSKAITSSQSSNEIILSPPRVRSTLFRSPFQRNEICEVEKIKSPMLSSDGMSRAPLVTSPSSCFRTPERNRSRTSSPPSTIISHRFGRTPRKVPLTILRNDDDEARRSTLSERSVIPLIRELSFGDEKSNSPQGTHVKGSNIINQTNLRMKNMVASPKAKRFKLTPRRRRDPPIKRLVPLPVRNSDSMNHLFENFSRSSLNDESKGSKSELHLSPKKSPEQTGDTGHVMTLTPVRFIDFKPHVIDNRDRNPKFNNPVSTTNLHQKTSNCINSDDSSISDNESEEEFLLAMPTLSPDKAVTNTHRYQDVLRKRTVS